MSYRGKRVTVYFPCRNEANHLKHVVDEVPDFVDELLIVSNRSTDDTIEKAQELGLRAIEDDRATNGIGYGYAHITGLAEATGDLIATADADLTYPIAELDRVLDHMLDEELDVVSCNRYPVQEGAEIP
jgi:glycosyltransferase involved in cell wall biosynthesis